MIMTVRKYPNCTIYLTHRYRLFTLRLALSLPNFRLNSRLHTHNTTDVNKTQATPLSLSTTTHHTISHSTKQTHFSQLHATRTLSVVTKLLIAASCAEHAVEAAVRPGATAEHADA